MMNHFPSTLFFAAAIFSAPSWSAEPAKPEKRILTRAELKECVDLRAAIDNRTKNYNAEVKRFNQGVDKSRELGNELKALQAAIQAGDESKTAEYNEKIELHNATGKQYDEGQLALAKLSEDLNATKRDFNAKCADRRFSNADLLQVKRPK